MRQLHWWDCPRPWELEHSEHIHCLSSNPSKWYWNSKMDLLKRELKITLHPLHITAPLQMNKPRHKSQDIGCLKAFVPWLAENPGDRHNLQSTTAYIYIYIYWEKNTSNMAEFPYHRRTPPGHWRKQLHCLLQVCKASQHKDCPLKVACPQVLKWKRKKFPWLLSDETQMINAFTHWTPYQVLLPAQPFQDFKASYGSVSGGFIVGGFRVVKGLGVGVRVGVEAGIAMRVTVGVGANNNRTRSGNRHGNRNKNSNKSNNGSRNRSE